MKKSILTWLMVLVGGGPVLAIAPVTLAQANGLKAALVSTNSPLSLKAGQSGTFEVAIKNSGTATWLNSGRNMVALGTIRPNDHAGRFAHPQWLGANRPATMQEPSVAPGEVAHFVFPAVASGKGRVTEYYGLVMEYVGWFKLAVPLTINVQPAIWQGELVSQSATALTLKTQESANVTVRIRNTGDTTWYKGGSAAVKVATINPRDRASKLYASGWLSKNRVATATANVEPGGEGEFTFAIQAPAKPGTYQEDFGLMAEYTAWLNVKFGLTVTVEPAIWAAELMNQSPSTVSVAPGDSATLWAEFRNTGNTVWRADGATPMKLGTARKLDRTSVMHDASWLSQNRVVAVQPAEVKPGETGRFEFTITAPNKIGKYQEYFRPIVERTVWLPEEVMWNISVDEELVLQDPIRVGITATTDAITVQGNDFVIRRGSDKSLVKKVNGGSVTATAFNGGYSLSTGEQVTDYLRFVPVNGALLTVQTSGIGSSYNTFRGLIEVRRSSLSGNVWVVNVLELEDYMKGIAEVPEGWPAEAQKAQMVAARTYAATKLRAPVADIFDIYDDTRDQVYYGYDYESSRPGLSAAADGTKGLIIKYNGQPISAYYFSDSGGYTANVEDVWSKALPYLRAVPDPYAKPIDWTATLTQDYLQQRFDQALNLQPNTDIVTNVQVAERFSSGRVKTALFTLQSGRTVSLSSKSFDYLTNNNDIKSMKFDVQPTGDPARPDFVFTGQGWGHGVGMAQWGAKNMALQGKGFQEILTYYYTGVVVGPR